MANTAGRNVWSDVSSIAQRVEEDATFAIRELNFLEPMITVYRDMTGMNLRRGYAYNQLTANVVSDADDLSSVAFTPSADQTLTPYEVALQAVVTDARAESELPENIITDVSRELAFAASDKIMQDIVAEFPNLTGGTVGVTGSTITWGYLAAAIAQARNANKSNSIPLVAVLHGYQWAVLSKASSVAGSSLAQAPGFTEEITRSGFVGAFMGVPVYQCFQASQTATTTDFTGAVFPREAIAIDYRRAIRVEAERDASRRATEFNMSVIYDCGVWKPARGVNIILDAQAITS